MKYILIDEQRRNNAIEYIKSLDIKKPIEILIKPYKKNRSLSQNSTYHMWLADIAPEFGYKPEELHETLKVRFLGVKEYMVDGVKLIKPKSTTELSTKEMAEYMSMVEMLAHSHNIRLRIPDDYNLALRG